MLCVLCVCVYMYIPSPSIFIHSQFSSSVTLYHSCWVRDHFSCSFLLTTWPLMIRERARVSAGMRAEVLMVVDMVAIVYRGSWTINAC